MSEQVSTGNLGPAQGGYAVPAEWAAHRRTWMCWPCRTVAWDTPQGLARAKAATAQTARAVAAFEPIAMVARPADAAEAQEACRGAAEIIEIPIDDSWARDSGPTFLAGSGRAGVAWQFNAWGEKYQPFDDDAALAGRILGHERARVYRAPLVCEGGAIHVDGEGTLITTEQCLLNPNRNPQLRRERVEALLRQYTGAERIVWFGGRFADEETDGHIDNIACFAAPGRIILGVPSSKSHPDFQPIAEARRNLAETRDARGRKIEIVEIVQPHKARADWRGRLLAASYVNFYLPNGGLVIPSFDDPADLSARAVLEDCFSARKIVQVDALDIVQGGGGIHCITQQEPA